MKYKNLRIKMICTWISCFILCGAVETIAWANTPYENPGDIIIAQPGESFETSEERVSILGACDYDYPLTMNGQEIPYTHHGFFAQYVLLQPGNNIFVFENNGKSKTVSIRRTSGTQASGVTLSPVARLSAGGVELSALSGIQWYAAERQCYVEIMTNSATRRSRNDENQSLLTPLARGTKARVLGEDSSYYCLADGTFVYKAACSSLIEGPLPENDVTGITLTPLGEFHSVEILFSMPVQALYDIEALPDGLRLTLYGTMNAREESNVCVNELVKDIRVEEQSEDAVVYRIELVPGMETNGRYVEFRDGGMVLGIKATPWLYGDSLSGARIMLDAGHGGDDPGAVGPPSNKGPVEKNIAGEITRYAKAALEEAGAQVVMTRVEDENVSLEERMDDICREKPDLFLSVHCNSMPVTSDYNTAQGFMTLYNFELEHKAVTMINQVVAEKLGLSVKTPVLQNSAVTRTQYCPAMLLETAFMSNPIEYEWLIQDENQRAFGAAIAAAAEAYLKSIAQKDVIRVYVNGESVAFDQLPVLEQDRTLVPMRQIFEALGAAVGWDEGTQTATAQKEGQTIAFTVDNTTAMVDGAQVLMEVPARILNDRTLVPLRFLSERLGYDVTWEDSTCTVRIMAK